jgi:toxin ParE1/3/4
VNYTFHLRPELLEDAKVAFHWYEEASTGLGHEFLRCHFAALGAIERQPLVYRKIYRDFRRVLLPRFPYAIYFRVEGAAIVVYLLIHCAREPALIRRSLRERRSGR